MVVIIPSYNPDYHLLDLLEDLKKLDNKIIIVNDGSNNDKDVIFNKVKKDVILLRHSTNMGKGYAMKTGMKYVMDNLSFEDGIIFVDGDHQHKAYDVKNVIDVFNKNKDSLILGVRDFNNRNVPIRSKFGNKITRFIFKIKSKMYISDTQTGLRCMNTKYIPLLLSIEGNKYEYEMNMLTKFVSNNINIVEVPISTIYEDKKNSTSNFKGFSDSLLIYKNLFKR